MKIFLAFFFLSLFILKSYSQESKHIRQIDSLVKSINIKSNLLSKTINDTAWLGYANGPRVIGHYFTLMFQFKTSKPAQLVKLTREKINYYYYLNELVNVEDNTDKPITLYFRNGQLIYSKTAQINSAFLTKYHLSFAKRFLDKFLENVEPK